MPASTAKSDFISNYRAQVRALMQTAETLKSLNDQYVALGYAGGGGQIVDGDFGTAGSANFGITAVEFKLTVGNVTPIAKSLTDNSTTTIAANTSSTIYPII